MCGVFGYMTDKKTTLSKEQQEIRTHILTDLALSMRVRGKDGAGILSVGDNKMRVFKKALPVEQVIAMPEYRKVLGGNSSVVIGHTRWKTVGEHTDEQTQPLSFGTTVGVHNGTITNYQQIYKKADVDSEAVFYALDMHRNEYKNAFALLKGACTVVWMDTNDLNVIHFFLRERSLSICFVKELHTYFWCSLSYSLKAVLAYYFDMEKIPIHTLKENRIYKLSNGTDQLRFE